MPGLVLASASPRRRQILAQLGIQFEVARPQVVEETAGDPDDVAMGNADRKAAAVARRFGPDTRVLGADTVVAVDGQILPKPRGAAEAREWLERLSGRDHLVVTAIALHQGCSPPADFADEGSALSRTTVRFRRLTQQEIDCYAAGGEWRDRAVGYAIQGRGAALVESIQGDYWTVLGLPVPALLDPLGPGWVNGG